MNQDTAPQGASISGAPIAVSKLRLGIILFIVWWLPVYLTVPAFTRLLGDQGNEQAITRITIGIIVVQSILGVIGLLLVGKQLAGTLKRVRYRKLPKTVWHIVVSGDTNIDPGNLKPIKPAKPTKSGV